MLSTLLYALERGWSRLIANTKLVFLAMTLFVLPLLFIVVLEQFYQVAGSNVQSAELDRTEAIHGGLAIILQEVPLSLPVIIPGLQESNSDLTKIRVYEALSTTDLQIIASHDEAELQSTTSIAQSILHFGRITPGSTFQIDDLTGDGRITQAVSYYEFDGQQFYLFTEFSRAAFDTVLERRKQDAYLVLTLMFVFMIGLAYWINRQTDWQQKYVKVAATLEERDLFSNMIAHEFRTPLTAIKGYAEFLQTAKGLTAEEVRFTDIIRESSERLVLLVNDFLEVARIQSGRMKLELEEIDVRPVIARVMDSLRNNADEKSLQLVYTPALSPQLLSTDGNRFVQILTNVVSNAVKYTDTGTVEVSAEQDRHGLTIRIKDTGMGISAEDQQKLFAPFSRVGGVEQTTTTGTGLGMWVTKQMIELLGGTIAVESIKDVGTHVVLHFRSQSK